uniref:Uncharacterized protein n=2 Tax=Canis lupus familiaris TaxID=9615 RepID=A0A8C0NN25_CANLF
ARSYRGGRADEEELQHPVADVGDGEGLVIADVGAARLGRVALEIGLLVAPHRLASQAQDEDAEDEKHRQPDLAHDSRVLLDLIQQLLEEAPVAHVHASALGTGRDGGRGAGSESHE